ncbi:MAG: glutaredoxin domain-containing protein [Ornithinimicrobium sp.]
MTSDSKTSARQDSTAQRAAGDVVIYWRPGCGFCARLRSTLGADGDKATWINIWEDKDAAAFVRSANDGNETVPTVVMDGIPITNPSPALVKEKLNA